MDWKDRLSMKILGNRLVIKILSMPIVLKLLMGLTWILTLVTSRFRRQREVAGCPDCYGPQRLKDAEFVDIIFP